MHFLANSRIDISPRAVRRRLPKILLSIVTISIGSSASSFPRRALGVVPRTSQSKRIVCGDGCERSSSHIRTVLPPLFTNSPNSACVKPFSVRNILILFPRVSDMAYSPSYFYINSIIRNNIADFKKNLKKTC